MRARLLAICAKTKDFPAATGVEIAVAGRSNCGKSSLINAIAGQRGLARTSSTPGRTRQLVFFCFTPPAAERFALVDLPGYGFAKVSKRERESWAPLVGGYIEHREQLRALLLLSDIRRPPAQEERDLLDWAAQRGLFTTLVLTKADKLAKNRVFGALKQAQSALNLPRRPLAFSINDKAMVAKLRQHLTTLARDLPFTSVE